MKKKSGSKLVITIVALIEIIAIAAGVTFAWMEGGNRGKIVSPELTISTGSDLTMIYNGTNQSAITIPAANLEEVSSADGRNFFFPLGNNTSSQTAQMKFREGTEADMQKYIVLDFDLLSSGAGNRVYLGADTGISTTSSELSSALRMAFLTNDQETPVVFAPSQMPGYYHNVSSENQQTFSPIAAISADGTPATMATVATAAYGDFHYHGSNSDVPIFELLPDERKHITLVIWLEGTEFNSAAVADKDLNINISFTTNVNDLQKINFYDNTHGYGGSTPVSLEQWVKNTETYNGHTYDTMMYVYANGVYYAMFRPDENDEDSWSVYIPNTLTSFTFRRYSPAAGTWWNEWNPYFTQEKYVTDANGEHTFVAVCGNGTASGTLLSGCYGYWKNSTGTYRVYFQNSAKWGDPYIYPFNSSDSQPASGFTWPGEKMTYSHKNGDYEVFYYDLNETLSYDTLNFNNNNRFRTMQIFSDDRGWSPTNCYLFYTDNGNKYTIGDAWPGKSMGTDSTSQKLRMVTEKYDDNIIGKDLYAVFSRNGNDQTGNIYLGKVGEHNGYYVNSSNVASVWDTHAYTQIEIDTSNYKICNGFALWFESSNTYGTGYGEYMYQGTTNSLIAPNPSTITSP